jgi:hypothetical protein
MCSPANRLAGLLHDCEEWIFHDIGRPTKGHPALAGYRSAAEGFRGFVLRLFGLDEKVPCEVKRMDNAVVWAEAEELHHGTESWPVLYSDIQGDIKFARHSIPWMINIDAERVFLEQFKFLTMEQLPA